jgi:hypothetical protein
MPIQPIVVESKSIAWFRNLAFYQETKHRYYIRLKEKTTQGASAALNLPKETAAKGITKR